MLKVSGIKEDWARALDATKGIFLKSLEHKESENQCSYLHRCAVCVLLVQLIFNSLHRVQQNFNFKNCHQFLFFEHTDCLKNVSNLEVVLSGQ